MHKNQIFDFKLTTYILYNHLKLYLSKEYPPSFLAPLRNFTKNSKILCYFSKILICNDIKLSKEHIFQNVNSF